MQWLNSINDITTMDFNNFSSDYPFLNQGFLLALEESKSIGDESGWHSHHYFNKEQNLYVPAFIKDHSYGEYVFDWGWAEAYQRHGLNYYPKLLLAAPFSPCEGQRIFSNSQQWDGKSLSQELQQHCVEEGLSGCHILYCNDVEIENLAEHGWHTRYSTQFHWFNYDYKSFDDFLSGFKSRKRKAVLKERKSIEQAGININAIEGKDITPEQWRFFYHCYQITYARRGMQGYINLDGFMNMQKHLPDQMVMMEAALNGEPVACALYFKDKENLYGRYWGAVKDIQNLHFEVCYYQGIEYCIKHNLKHFDPGTQGEHKIARGFEPLFKRSLHYLEHEGFHNAVGDFVKEEHKSLKIYKQQCYEQLPFNEVSCPEPK